MSRDDIGRHVPVRPGCEEPRETGFGCEVQGVVILAALLLAQANTPAIDPGLCAPQTNCSDAEARRLELAYRSTATTAEQKAKIKEYVSSAEAVLQAQISFAEGSAATGLFSGKGFLRRARTAMSTRDLQSEGDTNLQSKQKQLQATMNKLNGLHSKLHADLFYSEE